MCFFYVYHFCNGHLESLHKNHHLSIAPSIHVLMFRCISCLNMLLTSHALFSCVCVLLHLLFDIVSPFPSCEGTISGYYVLIIMLRIVPLRVTSYIKIHIRYIFLQVRWCEVMLNSHICELV